jgi:hypothetical protein
VRVDLAEAAGLCDGGQQARVPVSHQIEDGGRTRFTAREGARVTTRWVDQIDTGADRDDVVRPQFGALYVKLAGFNGTDARWCRSYGGDHVRVDASTEMGDAHHVAGADPRRSGGPRGLVLCSGRGSRGGRSPCTATGGIVYRCSTPD